MPVVHNSFAWRVDRRFQGWRQLCADASHVQLCHARRGLQARKLDVDTDMRPVVEFMRMRGVSVADVPKVSGTPCGSRSWWCPDFSACGVNTCFRLPACQHS